MLEIAIDADRCPLMIGISKAIDSARAPPARNQNANARRGLEPESLLKSFFKRPESLLKLSLLKLFFAKGLGGVAGIQGRDFKIIFGILKLFSDCNIRHGGYFHLETEYFFRGAEPGLAPRASGASATRPTEISPGGAGRCSAPRSAPSSPAENRTFPTRLGPRPPGARRSALASRAAAAAPGTAGQRARPGRRFCTPARRFCAPAQSRGARCQATSASETQRRGRCSAGGAGYVGHNVDLSLAGRPPRRRSRFRRRRGAARGLEFRASQRSRPTRSSPPGFQITPVRSRPRDSFASRVERENPERGRAPMHRWA